ncbi:MAG: hypothetical protein KGN34_15560 [Sphingomonadales bacterium]|nr:hypothetical protein [Sphingomonadales bacterium]
MHTEFVNFIVSIVDHVRRAGNSAVAGNYRVSPELSREELRREVLGILG